MGLFSRYEKFGDTMRCLILCFIFYAGGVFEGGNMFVLGGIYGLNH